GGGQRVGFGGEARRNEAGRKSTRTGKHDAEINRQRWPRLEGPRGGHAPRLVAVRRRARYAAGGGGGGLGGLGGGGFGGLGGSMWATHSRVWPPRRRRGGLATLHSIHSSARSRNDSGILRPSGLAVVRLTIRSYLVGCSTGRSSGLVPRRILLTYSAMRRNKAGKFGP